MNNCHPALQNSLLCSTKKNAKYVISNITISVITNHYWIFLEIGFLSIIQKKIQI